MSESPNPSSIPSNSGRVSVASGKATGGGRVLLSIVTVAWNGVDMIRRHLQALDACRGRIGGGIEVVVVDNASSDGTPDMIRREFPGVVLIANDANLGFAQGCRQGLEVARGDYLLLLNPDCEATPASLAAMMDFLYRFPEVGAVGCRLLHADGTPQRSAYRDLTPWRYVLYHSAVSPILHSVKRIARRFLAAIGFPVERWESNRPPRRCDWLMGACILVPRRVYEPVGGLEPAYFMYSEDADWCMRIRAAGFSVYHLPGVSMLHRQKQSSSRSREFTYVRLYRSMLMLCLRHLKPEDAMGVRRLVLVDMEFRKVLFPLLAVLRPASAMAHRQRLAATRRVARIWREMDPELDPDTPPGAPRL